ncbi:MAG TPA: hypothetical protein VGN25_08625 [Solirubrobacteraceae bacterium]|nr:hypothetical protein [Solirubrobacteraceae bacterium]
MEETKRSAVDRAMSRTEIPAPTRSRRHLALPLAIAATILLLTVCAATAAAATNIEGVWSFNGGQIAVQPEGNGKFEGIVVVPTKFAACTHPVEEKIWTGMTPQADGSYWGFHQWYFESVPCTKNPTLGATAWRVVEESNGSRYLQVCLSEPGKPQPTIPPGRSGIGASYGCVASALTAPLAGSGVGTFKQVVSLPSSKKCLSTRKFLIHIRDTQYDPFKSVVVTLRGHKLAVVHRGSTYIATVNLRNLPRGAFTVKIKGTTVRGNIVSGNRTYHTCAKKALNRSKSKKKH